MTLCSLSAKCGWQLKCIIVIRGTQLQLNTFSGSIHTYSTFVTWIRCNARRCTGAAGTHVCLLQICSLTGCHRTGETECVRMLVTASSTDFTSALNMKDDEGAKNG